MATRLLAVGLVLAGCARPAPIAYSIDPARVTEDDGHAGFPLAECDGDAVAVYYRAADGARGHPNAHVLLLSGDGREAKRWTLVSADTDEEPGLAVVQPRVEEALEGLAERSWCPMTGLEDRLPEVSPIETPRSARFAGAGVEVRYEDPKLTIRRDGETVVERDESWTVVDDEPRYPDCNPREDECFCENPAFVSGAWIGPDRRTLLLEVNYQGHDTCWEPDATFRVIQLP